MVIGIFGENCTGKSTLAEKLRECINARIYTGKDYLRLEKNEDAAEETFRAMLREAVAGENIIYVISEKEHLSLLPGGCVRVLATAELETIKARFAERMRGNLPAPVAAMLERNHGCFDMEPHDMEVVSGQTDLDEACGRIIEMSQSGRMKTGA